jgi:NhaP-type Na+/H+ or K+/H+ antiporter
MKTMIIANLLSNLSSTTSLVDWESIFNDGTAGAAYELILAILLPALGLAGDQ